MVEFTTTLIIFVIISIVALLSLFKWVRKAAKWALILYVAFTVATTIFGINVIRDAQEFNENFPKAQKLFLLKDSDTLLAGFAGKLTEPDEVLSYVTDEQLTDFQRAYDAKNLSAIRGTYFKLIIFDVAAFKHTPTMTLDGKQVSVDTLLSQIRAPDTLDRVVTDIIREEELSNTDDVRRFVKKTVQEQLHIETDQDMRAVLFAQLFSARNEDPFFIIAEFKEGTALIYPETITFKLVRIIPEFLIRTLARSE